MKLYICTNSSDKLRQEEARACIARLCENCRASIVMAEEDCQRLYGSTAYVGSPVECDYVVSIGGDGTVLRGAQAAVEGHIPLLGINNGRLGYLCAASMADTVKFTENTLSSLPFTQRTLLQFSVNGKEYKALNDVVIAKGTVGNSVQMHVCYRGEILAEWRCDGVIISTPTGSTAYTSSAGGPKLLYDLPCFVITPICPHHGTTRSLVVGHEYPITVNITERNDKRGYVCADGVNCGEILSSITIEKAKDVLTLLSRDPAWL